MKKRRWITTSRSKCNLTSKNTSSPSSYSESPTYSCLFCITLCSLAMFCCTILRVTKSLFKIVLSPRRNYRKFHLYGHILILTQNLIRQMNKRVIHAQYAWIILRMTVALYSSNAVQNMFFILNVYKFGPTRKTSALCAENP